MLTYLHEGPGRSAGRAGRGLAYSLQALQLGMGLSLVTLTIAASPAQAAPTAESDAASRARVHMRAGILHFNEGDLPAAVAEMKAAYRIHPVPQIQFNLALCYERQSDPAAAAAAYEAYLKGSPEASDAAEVKGKIAKLRAAASEPRPAVTALAPAQSAEPAPAPAEKAEGAAAGAAGAEEPKIVFKTLVVYKEAPPPAGRNARRAAAISLVLGGVTAAAAVTFAVMGQKTLSDLDAETNRFSSSIRDPQGMMLKQLPAPCKDGAVNQDFIDMTRALGGDPGRMGMPANNTTSDPLYNGVTSQCNLQNVARNAATANFIAASVGGVISVAALGGSLALYLYGRRMDRRQALELREASRRPELSLAPLFLTGGGGAMLAGSF